MPMYVPHKITVADNQTAKLKRAIHGKNKRVSITFDKNDIQKQPCGNHTLLLTAGQILKLQRAQSDNTSGTIIMRRKQIEANVKHDGGFLSLLAGLASKFAPALLTGVVSGAVERLVKGSGFYLHKHNNWYKVTPSSKGKGLYLTPRPPFRGTYGDGLFVKRGREITAGEGIIFGANSPFKNIPLLNLIL